MKKLNKTLDIKAYLQNGILTKPFLDVEFIKEKIDIDMAAKKKQQIHYTIIESLINWIKYNVKFNDDEKFVSKYIFSRTAQEVWESGMATGCTDYANVFATFARQLSIPTTIFYAVEESWLDRLIHGKESKMHYAHSFCECFFEGKWILVDPVCNKFDKNYSCEKLNLKYKLGEFSCYIPLIRCLDFGKKQSLSEHCDYVDKLCIEKFSNESIEVRLAKIEEIEMWWDKKIKTAPKDLSYKKWKENFVSGNKNGERKTFFAFDNGKYIGQGTLLLKSNNSVLTGNGKAEILKLEILPKYRGKGIATKIFEKMQAYAKANKIKTLTIGVEPCEIRNMQIYFHWGFTNFLQCIVEEYPPKAEGEKGEIITVLCYSKNI